MAIGTAVAGLSDSRRKTIAHLVSAQITDKPDPQEAQAIDTLAPGLTVLDSPTWRVLAHQMAKQHEDPNVRSVLINFVNAVDGELAEQLTGSKLPS